MPGTDNREMPGFRSLHMRILVRLAARDDLPLIAEIYNQAIQLRSATADMSPVSVTEREAWLAGHSREKYPVFVADIGGAVVGYCSLSAYRPGREALRYTAEISYFVHQDHRGSGVASQLIQHAIDQCPRLDIKSLFAILLDVNEASVRVLDKFGFQKWGHMPSVADFEGNECGHLYYGLRVVR